MLLFHLTGTTKLNIFNIFRLTDDDCCPWLGFNDRCRIPRRGKLLDAGCKQRNSYSLRNELFKVGPVYRLGNATDIMYEIRTAGPVQGEYKKLLNFFPSLIICIA